MGNDGKKTIVIDTLQKLGKREGLQYLKRIELIFHTLDLMNARGVYPFIGYDTYPCHFAHIMGIDLFNHVNREKCPIPPTILTGNAYAEETLKKVPQVRFIFLKDIRGVHDLKDEDQWKQLLSALSKELLPKGYWILWQTDETEYEWEELLHYLRQQYKEIQLPKEIQKRIISGPAIGDHRFYLGNSFRIFKKM